MICTTVKRIEIELTNDDIYILDEAQNLIDEFLNAMNKEGNLICKDYGGEIYYSRNELVELWNILDNLKNAIEIQ